MKASMGKIVDQVRYSFAST